MKTPHLTVVLDFGLSEAEVLARDHRWRPTLSEIEAAIIDEPARAGQMNRVAFDCGRRRRRRWSERD